MKKQKAVLVITFTALLSLESKAQSPGLWDFTLGTPNNMIMTTTMSAVGIGTFTPAGNLEVAYCGDQQNGLVITKKDCGMPYVIPASELLFTYDGVFNPLFEIYSGGGGSGVGFTTPPVSYFLSAYNTSNAKPLIWARTENPGSATTAAGPHTTQMIVTPYGRTGINVENPRATLDVKGLGNYNHPTLIIGRQVPGTTNRTKHIQFINLCAENAYNRIVQNGDQGMFFTDGTGNLGANMGGGFVIAPWANDNNAGVGGIRIDHLGNVEVHGQLRATKATIEQSWWNDKVFNADYKLMPLAELEVFLKAEKHLPEVPAEREIITSGIEVGDMLAIQMGKIEELTLYIIELNKQMEAMRKEIDKLKSPK